MLAVAIKARSKGDEDKLANALHRLQEEDLVLRIERNPETHQTVLRGMGETHLSIALEKLARKFGVEVDTEDVRVAYRETITGTAEAEGKLKKQTGGHGQFAVGVAARRTAGRAAPATSSSTRSSAASSPRTSFPRSRRASPRPKSTAARSASPSST